MKRSNKPIYFSKTETVDVDVDIEVDLKCSKCGNPLAGEYDRINETIEIKPCELCPGHTFVDKATKEILRYFNIDPYRPTIQRDDISAIITQECGVYQ